MANSRIIPEHSSFRDPSGHIFYHQDTLYRSVSDSYRENYDLLISSGLYQTLIDHGLMVSHAEVQDKDLLKGHYKVIQPARIPVISYPYEWSFSQLKDAALLTLEIQQIALKHGLSLKDATAYNIQFLHNRPILIDTLSFEAYQPKPWVAYKQFCQHFLAPLALMAHVDLRLQDLLIANLDGIPLDLASRLLPAKTRLQSGLLFHIHLHGKNQVGHANDASRNLERAKSSATTGQVQINQLLGILNSLEGAVRRLHLKSQATEWASYYIDNNNYVDQALQHKQELVGQYLRQLKAKSAVDIGANTGLFSMVAADQGLPTIALDIDPNATEGLYSYLQTQPVVSPRVQNLLPLLNDITNPSPGIGWANQERSPILDRIQSDAVLALAVIHHLSISSNIPLDMVAQVFHGIAKKGLIIEFVPKGDSQVNILLATRQDIFDQYTEQGFEKAFGQYFTITTKTAIKDSLRTLYLMEKK